MKQEDESGNSDRGQDGAMSGTAPKESISSGDINDATKVESTSGVKGSVSGSTNVSDGEDHAAEPTGVDSTADSTSPELNTSANTSGSSVGGLNSSSSCSEMTDGRPEDEMERSSSSCNDSVSESNPRDSLSSCSGYSTRSVVIVIDRTGGNCESSDMNHSCPPPVALTNGVETADESISESNPRDSLSSTSLSSTPGVSDGSGRNSETSDTGHTPPGPPPGTAPSSDRGQSEAVGDSPSEQDTASHSPPGPPPGTAPSSDRGQADAMGDSRSEQDTASQSAMSARPSSYKMTLRSGRVTQDESVSPKKHRDTSKMKKKQLGRPTKRRYSVDEQSCSSSEENPEKLLRLESSDTLACIHETDDSTSIMNIQSGHITNASSALPTANATITIAEDSPAENTDDAPVQEASDTIPDEQEEAVMNKKSVDEKFDTDQSEVAPDKEPNYVVKGEVLDQASTNSESLAYQSANNAMETDSLPRTVSGGDKDVRFCLNRTVPEMPASNVPSSNYSDVSMEDVKETKQSESEIHTSGDSALISDKKPFIVNNSTETTTDTFVQGTCDGTLECSGEADSNAPQDNSVETATGSRQVHTFFPSTDRSDSEKHFERDVTLGADVDVRRECNAPQDNSVETATGSRQVHPFFPSTDRRDSEKHFERDVTLGADVDVRRECMQAISQANHRCGPQEPAAAPDSSTEGTVGESASSTATKVQQQTSTNVSYSSETDVATDQLVSCASHDHRNSASSNTKGAEETAEKVLEETGDLERPEESGTLSDSSHEEQFDQRDLQIYRYITTTGGSDIRYSPYVTRRRPLRSGNGGLGNYRRTFIRGQRHEARRAAGDNALETTSSTPSSFGDTCCIS